MSEPKDFVAGLDSDVRKTPVRVAFVTRRTSPHVTAPGSERIMTYPGALFRLMIVLELLTIAMVWVSLLFDAPLEQLADPMHTPNPAKAPWYFLGLQELLHYFPPVVAGVLIPGLVVVALIVIPYFDVNIESEGFWLRGRTRKLQVFGLVVGALAVLLLAYHVYPVLIPTMLVAVFMLWAAFCSPHAPSPTQRWLAAKPLSYWIMTWFLINLVVLTAIGTYFRGPGWSWVWPWTTY